MGGFGGWGRGSVYRRGGREERVTEKDKERGGGERERERENMNFQSIERGERERVQR